MLRRLGWIAALLVLFPAAAHGQQATIGVYARVVARVETQRLVAGPAGTDAPDAATRGDMPASWRWEMRGVAQGQSLTSAPLLASGQGGAGWDPAMAARAPGTAAYVFAPI